MLFFCGSLTTTLSVPTTALHQGMTATTYILPYIPLLSRRYVRASHTVRSVRPDLPSYHNKNNNSSQWGGERRLLINAGETIQVIN